MGVSPFQTPICLTSYIGGIFFLLVWPPRSQSLLIMGWCSSIPKHRLWLPLDSVPFYVLVSYVKSPRVSPVVGKKVCLNLPPHSIPPHWSHWPPVTPPPPFPFPILMSPSPLLPLLSLQLPLCMFLPPLPLFFSAPAPDPSRSRAVLTIFRGPVSPPVAPSPHRVPESAASQQIARPYSVSGT